MAGDGLARATARVGRESPPLRAPHGHPVAASSLTDVALFAIIPPSNAIVSAAVGSARAGAVSAGASGRRRPCRTARTADSNQLQAGRSARVRRHARRARASTAPVSARSFAATRPPSGSAASSVSSARTRKVRDVLRLSHARAGVHDQRLGHGRARARHVPWTRILTGWRVVAGRRRPGRDRRTGGPLPDVERGHERRHPFAGAGPASPAAGRSPLFELAKLVVAAVIGMLVTVVQRHYRIGSHAESDARTGAGAALCRPAR